jgi:hypothetical protein
MHSNSVRVQLLFDRTMNFLILCFLAFIQTSVLAAPDRQRGDVVETSWYSSQSASYGLPHDEYGVPPPPALEYGVVPAVPQVVKETTEQ